MSVKSLAAVAVPVLFYFTASAAIAQDFKLALPVECKIGSECFLQQLPDMDTGPKTIDPFCGSATYDGHKGTDIRLLSMSDIGHNVPVIASAGGIVKAVRDNMPDRLIRTQKDRNAIKGRECGNAVIIDHGNGYETQYCHMKKGSVSVAAGRKINTGDRLGSIGASGFVQFPHLHIELRKDGKTIDPFTARSLGENCSATGITLWHDASVFSGGADATLLNSGLAAGAVEYRSLVETGGPPAAKAGDDAIVGWVWLANLKKGDSIAMKLAGPSGVIAENTAGPLEKNKANWSAFAGKRGTVKPGRYEFEITIIRNNLPMREHRRVFLVN